MLELPILCAHQFWVFIIVESFLILFMMEIKHVSMNILIELYLMALFSICHW